MAKKASIKRRATHLPKHALITEPNAAQVEALHLRYLELDEPDEDRIHPELRALAQGLGIAPAVAEAEARRNCWELEREAARGRAWLEKTWGSVKTEEEFVLRHISRNFHLLALGPEGVRFAVAMARETWRRSVSPMLQFDALREEQAAKEAYNQAQTKRQQLAELLEEVAP